MFIINGNDDWDPKDQHISETMHCLPSWSLSHLASLKYSCMHPQVFSLPSSPLSNSRISALKRLGTRKMRCMKNSGILILHWPRINSVFECESQSLLMDLSLIRCLWLNGFSLAEQLLVGNGREYNPSMVWTTLSHLVEKENIHTGKDLSLGMPPEQALPV